MGTQWNSILGLSVISFGPYYRKAWLMGVEIWKHRACCYTSWLRAHLWSCTRRFVAASLRGGHAMSPGYSVWGGFVSFKIWTHLLLYSCVVHVRVWVLQKVGLCMVSSWRKRCMLARHLLVVRSRCKQTPVSTSQAQTMECPILPFGSLSYRLSSFSRGSVGNINGGAAEERRIRRKGENAKVRAPRRRHSSWRRRKRRPRESIWGCSVTQDALANRSQGNPVQFPGALGLDIPFSLLCTVQIGEEHAYDGFQGPLYLFDPCRLGLFLAYCAEGSGRSNFPWA